MKNVKNMIKLAAALGALYLVIQVVNPTVSANANVENAEYNAKFFEAKATCEKVSGSKKEQVLKYSEEVCINVAHDIAKESTK